MYRNYKVRFAVYGLTWSCWTSKFLGTSFAAFFLMLLRVLVGNGHFIVRNAAAPFSKCFSTVSIN